MKPVAFRRIFREAQNIIGISGQRRKRQILIRAWGYAAAALLHRVRGHGKGLEIGGIVNWWFGNIVPCDSK